MHHLFIKELISLKESIRIDGDYNYKELQKESIDSLTALGIKVEYLELLSLDDFFIKQKNNTDISDTLHSILYIRC